MTTAWPPILAQSSAASTGVDLLVVLATAGLTALISSRLRITTIPGYLLAGAIIGPHALELVRSPESVAAISQLSTILLMFTIGLSLDMARVRTGLMSIVGAAVAATIIMTFIAWPIAHLFTGSWPSALVIAMAMSIAATAAPLRILESRRALHTTYGRLAFGITLFQDLIAVAMLATLPVVAFWAGVIPGTGSEGETRLMDVASRVAIALGALALLILLGRYLLPRLLAEAGRAGGEVLIVVSAATALGAAVLTASVGFSPELGAFLAGFLLASTPFRYQVSGQLAPMRDLFLAVFFTSVGLLLPLGVVVQGWWIVLLGLFALGIVKVSGICLATWALGAASRFGLLAAVVLAPAGEFTLVMIMQGSQRGILGETEVGYAIAVIVLSVLSAPLILKLGNWATPIVDRLPHAPWIRTSVLRTDEPTDGAAASESHRTFRAIVAGFGPVGRAVTESLQKGGFEVTVVELNPKTVQTQTGLGRRVVFGDVSNSTVLLRAGIEACDAVILTMPDEEATLRSIRVIRSLRPEVFIAARANALSIALQAMQLGADHAVVEEIVTAEAMATQVMMKVKARFEQPRAIQSVNDSSTPA